MYVVLKSFDDLCDSGRKSCHRYKPGDLYPRKGYKPTSERVRALLTGDNALGIPLICIRGTEQANAEPVTVGEAKKPTAKTAVKAASGTSSKRKPVSKRAAETKKTGTGTKKATGTTKKAETGSRSVRPVSRLNK